MPAQSEYRNLRVAVISDALPERNGVGTYYRDLVQHLDKHLATVKLFCPKGEEDVEGWIRMPLPGDKTQTLHVPALRGLRNRFKELRPDVVILPTPGPFGLYGLMLAQRRKIPIVIGFHTHYERLADLYWSKWFGKLSETYLELANKLLFRYAVKVLANSEMMVKAAEAMGAKNAELMGTPLPARFFDTPLKPLQQPFGKLLFVGRLADEKNPDALLQAVEQLPEFEFVVAGDGPLRARFEQAAARFTQLQYLDWVPRESLLDCYDQADLLLLPSHVEAFGTVALEAMARRRNVLVSPHCGIVDWPRLRAGLYVMESGQSLADAIRHIAALTPQQRQQKADTARQAAIQLSDWNLQHWLQALLEAREASRES